MDISINPKKSLSDISIVAKDVVTKNKVAKSQVVAVFDVSGSMGAMYTRGIVKALATRVLALGLELDDNGIIPTYALDESCRRVKDLTKDNLETFVDDHLLDLVGGSTNYAPSINKIVADAEKGDPMLVLLFTDGENFDKQEATEALIRASDLPIFFQWYGIYERETEPSFKFLRKMDEMAGRTVDNAGFSPLGLSVVKADAGTNHDEALLADMVKEYKDFPQKAMMAGANWSNLAKVHGAMKVHKKFLGLF